MDEPWGLTGPQFLGVYAGALLISLVLAQAVRVLLRRGPARKSGRMDVYTLAAVTGGARRVADTAVHALIESGHLRVGRNHTITVCDGDPGEAVQREVLACLSPLRNTTMDAVRKIAVARDPVRRIVAGAVEQGLLLDPRRRRSAALAVLLPLAVFAVGIARLVDGIRLGRPVGLLVLFLILTVPVIVVLAIRTPRRTWAGRKVVNEAERRDGSGRRDYAALDSNGARVPSVVLGVATLGIAGVSDAALRSALYGSVAASTGSGAGSGYAGSGCGTAGSCGSGGGCGSSCGGGGGGCGG